MFCQFWSRLSYMYIVEYTNIKTNWRRIFSTKKLRGGRPSPATSSAHLPAVKFSSALPPMFSWYFMLFFLSPGYHLLMLRLNPRNNEVVLKTCCQYESIRIFVFAFSTSCVKLFPSLFLQLKRRPDFGQGWLGGWWAPSTSWSIWFLRKSQAGSTRLDSGWWAPHSAHHATCSNNTYRPMHM